MQAAIANKSWITFVSLLALVVSTFVTSAPAMALHIGMTDSAMSCGMIQTESHHAHHSANSVKEISDSAQCTSAEPDSHTTCCTTMCGTTLGFSPFVLLPIEGHARFSKRSVDPFTQTIHRIEHLERPPSA